MTTNFEFVKEQLERAEFEISFSCKMGNGEKGYFDGKLRNNIWGVISILNEYESEIRLNTFGHLTVKIPNTEVFNFIHQMSK